MSDVAVIGGGSAGLSAALFTAKNDLDTVVFDTDDTAMTDAWLYNYLGIESNGGDEFMEIVRKLVDDHGAERKQGEEVIGVEWTTALLSLPIPANTRPRTSSSPPDARATWPRHSAVNWTTAPSKSM